MTALIVILSLLATAALTVLFCLTYPVTGPVIALAIIVGALLLRATRS